jgi:acyl-CoA synthetase (AMP-forming)/AMP-acid ligase II
MPTVTAGRADDPPDRRAQTDGQAIGAAQVRAWRAHGSSGSRARPGRRGRRCETSRRASDIDGHGVARQKFPEHLEIVPRLPRTPSGKIKKFELRRRAAALRADAVAAT